MERKGVKKHHLKRRILRSIFFVLLVSMVLSTAAGYLHFENIVREQKIYDEQTKLAQVSDQLAFMTGDIQKFAESILVDGSLQDLLEEQKFESEFDRQRNYANVAERLVFYNSLRTYIVSSVLQMENGIYYGSSYSVLGI